MESGDISGESLRVYRITNAITRMGGREGDKCNRFILNIASYESYRRIVEGYKWQLGFDREQVLNNGEFKSMADRYENVETETDKFMDYMTYVNNQLSPMVI